jgi:hypothetical protein
LTAKGETFVRTFVSILREGRLEKGLGGVQSAKYIVKRREVFDAGYFRVRYVGLEVPLRT